MTQAIDTDIDLRTLILSLSQQMQRMDQKIDAIAADVVEIKIAQAKADERFNTVDERFNTVDERFNSVDERFNSVDQRFNSLDRRMDGLEEQFKVQDTRLENRFRAQDNRIWSLLIGVVLALVGLLAKMAFFPVGQV